MQLTKESGRFKVGDFLSLSNDFELLDSNQASECAFSVVNGEVKIDPTRRVCSSNEDLLNMAEFLYTKERTPALHKLVEQLTISSNNSSNTTDKTISSVEKQELIHRMTKALNVKLESDIYSNIDFIKYAAKRKAMKTFSSVKGPRLTQSPLTDRNIEQPLYRFSLQYPIYFPFQTQMNDFLHDPVTGIKNFNFAKSIRKGKRCFGMIVNSTAQSDCKIPQNPNEVVLCGSHWFTIFMDFRNLSDQDVADCLKRKALGAVSDVYIRRTKLCTLEYFNSSSRILSEHPEIIEFFNHVEHQLIQELPGINIWKVSATRKRQQYSKAECGTYSVFYNTKRLEKKDWLWFVQNRIPDTEMFEFRKLLYSTQG